MLLQITISTKKQIPPLSSLSSSSLSSVVAGFAYLCNPRQNRTNQCSTVSNPALYHNVHAALPYPSRSRKHSGYLCSDSHKYPIATDDSDDSDDDDTDDSGGIYFPSKRLRAVMTASTSPSVIA